MPGRREGPGAARLGDALGGAETTPVPTAAETPTPTIAAATPTGPTGPLSFTTDDATHTIDAAWGGSLLLCPWGQRARATRRRPSSSRSRRGRAPRSTTRSASPCPTSMATRTPGAAVWLDRDEVGIPTRSMFTSGDLDGPGEQSGMLIVVVADGLSTCGHLWSPGLASDRCTNGTAAYEDDYATVVVNAGAWGHEDGERTSGKGTMTRTPPVGPVVWSRSSPVRGDATAAPTMDHLPTGVDAVSQVTCSSRVDPVGFQASNQSETSLSDVMDDVARATWRCRSAGSCATSSSRP